MLKVIGESRLHQGWEMFPEELFSEAMWTAENWEREKERERGSLSFKDLLDDEYGALLERWGVGCSPRRMLHLLVNILFPQIGKGQNFLDCPQKGKIESDGDAEGPSLSSPSTWLVNYPETSCSIWNERAHITSWELFCKRACQKRQGYCSSGWDFTQGDSAKWEANRSTSGMQYLYLHRGKARDPFF